MIEKRKVLFDLYVTEVVPVADLSRVDLVKKRGKFALRWNFLVFASALDSQTDILRSRVINDAAQATFHSLQINRRDFFTSLYRFQLQLYILARQIFSGFSQFNQRIGDGPHFDLTQVQHHKWCAQPLGEIDCLKGLPDCAFAFLRISSGKPEAVGRRYRHFYGQWTKVMQAAKTNFARFKHFLDPRDQ